MRKMHGEDMIRTRYIRVLTATPIARTHDPFAAIVREREREHIHSHELKRAFVSHVRDIINTKRPPTDDVNSLSSARRFLKIADFFFCFILACRTRICVSLNYIFNFTFFFSSCRVHALSTERATINIK